MRILVQTLTELFDSPPSTKIKDNGNLYGGTGHSLTTGHVEYGGNIESEKKHKYHPDYSGTTHTVAWDTNKKDGNTKEKHQIFTDALHTHKHYIQHKTNVGDIVKNIPTKSDDGEDKRARIYKKVAGFGSAAKHDDTTAGHGDREQHGIVKQHPDNHPDEDKRGKKYLHPLDHTNIKAHEDAYKESRTIRWK
jgi:hypothetical protein